jgi:hypothetical protein
MRRFRGAAVADSPSVAEKTVRKGTVNGLNAVERQRAAIELRKVGNTFQEIADELGYASASGAQNAVLSALRKTLQEPTDELRKLECERLDVMLKSIWPFVLRGSPRHVEMAIKIMDRRASYMGLDAPKQVEDNRTVTIAIMAEQIASETGLNKDEIPAEAQAIITRSIAEASS